MGQNGIPMSIAVLFVGAIVGVMFLTGLVIAAIILA